MEGWLASYFYIVNYSFLDVLGLEVIVAHSRHSVGGHLQLLLAPMEGNLLALVGGSGRTSVLLIFLPLGGLEVRD